jgi:WD40 repeat protein
VGKKPRLDHYGDPLPPGAVARMGTVRFRHGGTVTALAISPDGKVVASGGRDTIYLWERATGKCLLRFAGHKGYIFQLDFVPGSKVLASAGVDGNIVFWDAASGKELRRIKGSVFAFSVDGKLMAAGEPYIASRFQAPNAVLYSRPYFPGRTVYLGDVAMARELRRLPVRDIHLSSLALSLDGETLACCGSKFLSLIEAASGKKRILFAGQSLDCRSLRFTSDGKTLIFWGRDGLLNSRWWLRSWDGASGKALSKSDYTEKLKGPGGYGLASALSADGNILFAGSDWRGGYLLQVTGKTETPLAIVQRSEHLAATFSPDGQMLAAAGWGGTVNLLKTATGNDLLPDVGQHGGLSVMAFSPDGLRLASVSETEQSLRLWEAHTGRQLQDFKAPNRRITSATYSPDGDTLATSDGTGAVDIWETKTGKYLRPFTVERMGTPCSLAFAPDGHFLATGCMGGQILLWDVGSRKLYRRFALPASTASGPKYPLPEVSSVAYSSDGRLLATGAYNSRDSDVRVWEVATGRVLFAQTFRQSNVILGGFSPDGRRLALSRLGWVELWEIGSGQDYFHQEQPDIRAAMSFSHNGRLLAFSGPDYSVRLWDLRRDKERTRLLGHLGAVTALAFSPDGKRLASGSADTTGLVWDVSAAFKDEPAKEAALDAKRLEPLWKDLASDDAAKAYQAILALTAAPKQSVLYLKDHLKPVPPPDPKKVAQLIKDLSSAKFAVRDKATQELKKAGELVEPDLQKAAKDDNTPLELRRRVEQILAKVQGPVL